MHGDELVINVDFASCTRNRHPRRRFELQGSSRQCHLECWRIEHVADETVRKAERQRVRRARPRHAKVAIASPRPGLHESLQPCVLHEDAHDSATTNFTRSPGASRNGVLDAGLNRAVSVRPMICQPPGPGSA